MNLTVKKEKKILCCPYLAINMLYYIYDNSFEGLLTAVFTAYAYKTDPDDIIPISRIGEVLFGEKIIIQSDIEKAERVMHGIQKKISDKVFRKIVYAFLSEIEGIENNIFQYIKLGFSLGKELDNHLTNSVVLRIRSISRKVGLEISRLKGLVRFKKLDDNIYYSPFAPDYNIISLLAPHFARRFATQKWILHDTKRKLMIKNSENGWEILEVVDFEPKKLALLEKNDKITQDLWQNFYKNITIPERKNITLQKKCMPQRYWKYLIEI